VTRVTRSEIETNLTGKTMENRIVNTHSVPESRRKTERALLMLGVWLRSAFIGASVLMAGLIQWVAGELTPLAALVLAFGGGMLAIVSWRRAWTVLESVERSVAVTHLPSPAETRVAAGA
jgi:hypothetical protein